MRQGLVVALDDAYEAALWTQDADFADLDGVKFVPRRGAL